MDADWYASDRYRYRCSCCGRFVPWNADSYNSWGRDYDLEPPDPEEICAPCAASWKDHLIAMGYFKPTKRWWRPPRFAVEAEKEIAALAVLEREGQ